ncbi:MAG: hypothetical protein ACOYK6_02115 [Chthoniobacterales bacterium]
MKIFFYIPEKYLPSDDWIEAWNEHQLIPLEEIGFATMHAWIYQTWALLNEAGVDCDLTDTLPREGIFIALRGSLPSSFGTDAPLPENLFFVDIVADGFPHPAAQLHLVQNKAHTRLLPRSLFVPHWTQPCLMPRDAKRGHRFEKICFFGDSENLEPTLRTEAWHQRLKEELDITFEIRGAEEWHDYSDVDGVIAIRSFSSSHQLHKPATKLYNAWQAGVPFIGGNDSAYKADGNPGKNYLIATSAEDVFGHLKKLKEDERFRVDLVNQGVLSGKKFTREATLEHWKKLVQETIPLQAREWQQKSQIERSFFVLTQRLICFLDRSLRA